MDPLAKILLTIFAAIVVIFVWSILNIFKTVEDAFSGGQSNEGIVKYVKEKHGIDVQIIENTGPRHLERGTDGVATVRTTDDSIEFSVFINSFGSISDDNYEYMVALPEIEHLIDEDIKQLTPNPMKEIRLLTDERYKTLDLLFILPNSINYEDNEFIERVDQAIKVFQQRNKQLKNDYKYYLENLFIKIPPPEETFHTTTDALLYDLEYEYDSVEELKDELITRNHRTVMQLFVDEVLAKLDPVSESLPKHYQFVTFSHSHRIGTPFDCVQFDGFAGCKSYAVSIELAEETDYDDFENHRYDNAEVKKEIFEVIQVLQTVDLPIDHLVVVDLYVPKDLTLQNESEEQLLQKEANIMFHYETVEIRNIREIKAVDEIVFEAYER